MEEPIPYGIPVAMGPWPGASAMAAAAVAGARQQLPGAGGRTASEATGRRGLGISVWFFFGIRVGSLLVIYVKIINYIQTCDVLMIFDMSQCQITC